MRLAPLFVLLLAVAVGMDLAAGSPSNPRFRERRRVGDGKSQVAAQKSAQLPLDRRPSLHIPLARSLSASQASHGASAATSATSSVNACSLQFASGQQLEEYMTPAVLSRVGVDGRRLLVFSQVDKKHYEKAFDKTGSYVATGFSWALTGISFVPGIEAVTDVISLYQFIEECYHSVSLMHNLIVNAQTNFAEDGASARLLSAPGVLFINLDTSLTAAKEGIATHGATLAEFRAEMKKASENWGKVSSVVTTCSRKVLTNPFVTIGWWLGEAAFVAADIATVGGTGAAHAAYAFAHAGAGVGAAVAETAGDYNLESKLKYMLYSLYLFEATYSGKFSVIGLRHEVKACSVVRDHSSNHGCNAKSWCQIEFTLLPNSGTVSGDGHCMPAFRAYRLEPGADCLDNSDCLSGFCHLPHRYNGVLPRPLKTGLIGKCRVAVPAADSSSSSRSEAIAHYSFHLAPLAA